MSGHSKWSTIKRKKAKVDAQRGAAFAKCSREIIVAAKMGGADIKANFRLRTAVEKAKTEGLPSDNIKRAIEKGSGASNSENFEELTYEGYGAGGVAIFIEALTDNRNRTAGDLRSYFTKYNGNLGENGCVGWMFKQVGMLTFDKTFDYDTLFDQSIEAGAQDFQTDEDSYKVITAVSDFQSVVEALEAKGYAPKQAELTRMGENSVEVEDTQIANLILKLMERIEEHDDVQNVYSNFDIDDEILSQIA